MAKPPAPTECSADEAADLFERQIQQRKNEQFLKLREEAQSLLRTVKGLPGVRNEELWNKMLEKAGADYQSGRFLMERIGARRYLDPELMAVLIQIRQRLLENIDHPTAADQLLADSAIIAYRQMLRVQAWIDSICLVVERQLFGRAGLTDIHGPVVGNQLETQIRRLENEMLPLLHRSQKMLISALDRLDRRPLQARGSVSINRANQVNVGSAVQNN